MEDFIVTKEIFTSFKSGDQRAFLLIYEGYRRIISMTAYEILKDDAECEDVTMKTFYTLWREREAINDEEHVFRFLYRVCRNSCLDICRAQRRRRAAYHEFSYVFLNAEDNVLEEAKKKELEKAKLLARVYQAIEHLPKKTRKAFILRYFEGISPSEIATRMNIDQRTVYSHTQNATRALRDKLAVYLDASLLLLLVSLSAHISTV